MKIHKLNSRQSNSIDWSKQEYPRYWDYSGPIAVVKSMTDINFGSEDWGNKMPKYILGFLPTEVQDKIYESLELAPRGTQTITPWDFLSKSDSDHIKKHFGENGLREPKYFSIKGKDGKSYFIADIITEDAWKKFIAKVPEFAKYKIEEFTPGYSSNSRLRRINSSMPTSIPDALKKTGLRIESLEKFEDSNSFIFWCNGLCFGASYGLTIYEIILVNYGRDGMGIEESISGEFANAISVNANSLKTGILTLTESYNKNIK